MNSRRIAMALAAPVLALALAGCEEGAGGGPAAAQGFPAARPSGMTEYMVLGGGMSFAQCKAAGGLIITDPGRAMVACDPRVKRPTVIETNEI